MSTKWASYFQNITENLDDMLYERSLEKRVLECLRIMQVSPLGQKKPSQQDIQFLVLSGKSLEFCRSTCSFGSTLQAQPGSQPETHDVMLQFPFGCK